MGIFRVLINEIDFYSGIGDLGRIEIGIIAMPSPTVVGTTFYSGCEWLVF
jgi:hypothetical protein